MELGAASRCRLRPLRFESSQNKNTAHPMDNRCSLVWVRGLCRKAAHSQFTKVADKRLRESAPMFTGLPAR